MKDIFNEDKITPVKGLIKRYSDRVLLELTLKCSQECDFCYRKWKKEAHLKDLSKKDIDKAIEYISKDKKIEQVILSGGDPLFVVDLLEYSLKKISEIQTVKIIRIHSRLPIVRPDLVSRKIYKILSKKYKKIIYLSLHVNHINEISKESEKVINNLRKIGLILYSQSVLLKGVNDSVLSLSKLFKKLVELGVRPYNLYKCNKIKGLEKYMISFEKSVEIITELRKNISGFCCPNLIIDVPGNANKIPVPLSCWQINTDYFLDFEGKKVEISSI